MNRIRHLRHLASVLAGLAGVPLAFGATPAFASDPHPDPGEHRAALARIPRPHTITLVAGGIPGWQITFIAIDAALLAAT